MEKQIIEAADYIKQHCSFRAEVALVLGTGLNDLADSLTDRIEIPYNGIPGFQVSTAPSHQGKLVTGKLENREILVMQGRLHYYEGYSMEQITFPVRVLKELGIKVLVLTNAAGSLNEKMQPGDLVMLKDHINFMGTNPLIGRGEGYDEERFPSLHNPYDEDLRNLCRRYAEGKGYTLQEGVYAAVSGPSFETRAECAMLAGCGADVVGMSTVPEVIVAVQQKLRVLAFSTVTNMSNLFHKKSHSQREIRENAKRSRDLLQDLIKEIKPNII